ncbi:unnamed protein product [Ectocarpus sp. CCAP 1310/34]|nr:unnamed protein product [Ectocarpus sp. CCAP 1310/34]
MRRSRWAAERMTGARRKGPMENPDDGASCSTYEEHVEVAKLLDSTCEWDPYMCCWTGNDGADGMTANSDVCRVLDYPEEGDSFEMPRESEGFVCCHGFAWAEGADVDTHILPLYHYVKNVGRTEEAGFYEMKLPDSVEGTPECGCIEEIPSVSCSECSRYSWEGIAGCGNNGLLSQYRGCLGEPCGPMDDNLVRTCDNEDIPDYDHGSCSHNTYMCCLTENDGQGMAENTVRRRVPAVASCVEFSCYSADRKDVGLTMLSVILGHLGATKDVCRVLDYPSVGGALEFAGDSEREAHRHGFVWTEDATDKYIHLLSQFVQKFDHRDRRGYYGKYITVGKAAHNVIMVNGRTTGPGEDNTNNPLSPPPNVSHVILVVTSIEGAPMYGCVEEMPVVSEADGTTYDTDPEREGKFTACTTNDLCTRYAEDYPTGELANLVGTYDNAE